MAAIAAPAIAAEPRRSIQSHQNPEVSFNMDSQLENQIGHYQGGSSKHPGYAPTRRRTRRREKSRLELVCAWVVEHQTGLAANLLLLLALTHICYPRARHYTRKFYKLAYYDESRDRYALGWDDIFLVIHWIVAFTGLRAATMDYVLTPLAQLAGIEKKKDMTRFAEQAWLLVYYAVFFPLGMYIFCTSKYWLNLRELWTDWPTRDLDGPFKWYYLVQFAFWLQQIVVVNIEERRKDHWQMFSHHIVTCALIFGSYGYHFYRVGNVILCLMDAVDIVLSSAKILKYLGFGLACDVAFGVFMVSWLLARHVSYLAVTYSAYADAPVVIGFNCFKGGMHNLSGPFQPPQDMAHYLQPFTDPEGIVCLDKPVYSVFIGLLLTLQVLLLVWFTMIVKVAYKVLKGGGAEDTRSDDEASEDELTEEDEVMHVLPGKEVSTPPFSYLEMEPQEEVVGVEGIRFTSGRTSPMKRTKKGEGAASTTGMSLRGHSAHKELLGRIGCDKQA